MKNAYRIDGETVIVEVVSKGETHEVLLDKEDFERFNNEVGSSLCLHSGRYACYKKNGESNLLHRWVTGFQQGLDTDHVNGNKKDNRKQNLRVCSRSTNNINMNNKYKNKTGESHVYFQSNSFYVKMTIDKELRYFFGFKTIEEAVKARNELLKQREEVLS